MRAQVDLFPSVFGGVAREQKQQLLEKTIGVHVVAGALVVAVVGSLCLSVFARPCSASSLFVLPLCCRCWCLSCCWLIVVVVGIVVLLFGAWPARPH